MRSFVVLLASVAAVALACGSSGKDGGNGSSATGPDGGPGASSSGASGNGSNGGPAGGDPSPTPYNQVTLKTIHNSYDQYEPLLDQMLYDNVRSLEIDIHKGKGSDAPPGQWWVYHADIPTQDSSSCKFLDDCLTEMAAFHKAMPNHEVVTLYIDLKDDFVPGHNPEDLDARFTEILGRDNIATPADFIKACNGATTVRASVTTPCKWPSLGALRGKFIIAGTGGSRCDDTSQATQYVGQAPNDRVMFISADLNDNCPLDKYDAFPEIVFFNMALADKAHAQGVKDKGLVGRMYKGGFTLNGGLDSAGDFDAAKTAGAIQLATDEVNVDQDPWSTTTAAKGFPFQCADCDNLKEASPLLAVSATSGDQWDTADSGFYAYETDDQRSVWTAMIAVPSSHTEDFAKACLIARASEDPGAANVALCRPFDNHPPRIQIRSTDGDSTSTNDAPPWPNYSDETSFFIRLVIEPSGDTTNIDAQLSKDGKTFTSFQQSIVNAPLPLRGISVSSHGSGKKHAFFAGLSRSHTDLPPSPITASMLTKKPIGDAASGDLADGALAP